jgi:hypothetical protein
MNLEKEFVWKMLREIKDPTDNIVSGKIRKVEHTMQRHDESGKAGYIIAWAMGVPVSLLLIVFLLRGCT